MVTSLPWVTVHKTSYRGDVRTGPKAVWAEIYIRLTATFQENVQFIKLFCKEKLSLDVSTQNLYRKVSTQVLWMEEIMNFRMIQVSLDYLPAIKSYSIFTNAIFKQSMVFSALLFLHVYIFVNRPNTHALL